MPPPSVPLDAIRQPALLYDTEGRIVAANDRAEMVAGQPLVGLMAHEVSALLRCCRPDGTAIAPEDLPLVQALAGEQVVDVPLAVTSSDGRTLDVILTASPIREGDRVTAVLTVLQDVTRMKQTEGALRESEERFRLALRNSPVAVSVMDRDLRYVWAYNQRTATPEEIIGRTDADIFTADEAAHSTAIKRRVLEEGVEVHDQQWLDRPGGRIFLDVYYEPVRDEAGRVTGVGIATVDLTQRKLVEEALAESEERFRALYEQSHDAIVLTDPRDEGCILAANLAACRMLGWAEEEIVGRGRDVLFDPADPGTVALLQERARTGAAFTELMYRRRDGSTFPGEVTTALFTDGRGELRSVAIIRDITDRKEVEAALRESETRFRSLSETSPIAISVTTADGRTLYVNRAHEELFGYTSGDPERTQADDFYFDPRDRETMLGLLREQGTVRDHEVRLLRRDGTPFWASLSVSPIVFGGERAILGLIIDITERKDAAEALRESEERFRALYESSRDAIVLTDPQDEGRILAANPAACRMLGWAEEELVGRGRDAMLDPDDPAVAAVLRERGRDGAAFTELMYRRRDGSTFPGELGTALFRDSRGDVRSVAIIRDITERKRFEHALAESEADARSFMENMVDACAICETVCDADRTPVDIRLVDVNPALERELGLPASAIVGRTATEILPELAAFWFDRFLEVERTGAAIEVEEPFPALGRWYRVVGFPVRGGRTAVLFRDITLRKQAEEALAESEERYRSLVENSIDAVLLTAPDGSILAANPEACRIYGMTEEELIQGGRNAIIDPADPQLALALEERQRTGRFKGELRQRRKDGTVFPGEVSTALFTDPSGAVLTTMIVRDVTERKEAEAALHGYAERLRTSNEELQRFAYVASHDLQEPLRSIVSFSQLLERRYRGKLDTDADEYIDFIVEGGNRMQALIRDLLQLSRIETQAQPPVPIGAGAVVADAVSTLEPLICETGAMVTVGPMPTVMADPGQLEQVFVNLIGNAIKYRRNDVPPAIQISGWRVGPMVEIAVKDNGIGIEPEYFDRIFEMFQRLHTHDEYGGTGIGLAVVKKIVERHGGTVRVESTPGEGSTFFFTLPVA